ncbi:myeloid-associated differentiation marker-like [Oryx dammah]|uniref:myeloid-associated differentiation marker-like n=1 Tax=Oryx dammah TaxID=59534 RepID=UPI001A9B33C1|nr:myeloid-associated differentiation marker-like [Oryx dammah]
MSTRWTIADQEDVNTLCCLLRLPQAISMCVAFSVVASMGNERGAIGNWCLAIWCLCFIVTVFISMFEWIYHDRNFPFCWYKLPITYACYAALLCLLTSIIYPALYVQYLPDGPSRDQAIAASAFSCIACVLYATDVACTWKHYKLKNIPCYVHTLPGLLKILESAVACAIFVFLSNTSLYLHQPALKWCVAVYSICFIQVAVAMLLRLSGWENRLPLPLPIFHLGQTLLSSLLYASALVLWPLYQFDEKLGGHPHWYSEMSCIDELTDYGCVWDQRLAVAVLTAINLLIYAADLVYWARQVSVGTEDQPSTP